MTRAVCREGPPPTPLVECSGSKSILEVCKTNVENLSTQTTRSLNTNSNSINTEVENTN